MGKCQDLYKVENCVWGRQVLCLLLFPFCSLHLYSNCIRKWSVTDCSGLAFLLLTACRINALFLVWDITVLSLSLIINSSKLTDCELEVYLCKRLRKLKVFIKIKNCNWIDELINLYCIYIYIKELQLFLWRFSTAILNNMTGGTRHSIIVYEFFV